MLVGVGFWGLGSHVRFWVLLGFGSWGDLHAGARLGLDQLDGRTCKTKDSGIRVRNPGFRISDVWFRVLGLWFRVEG